MVPTEELRDWLTPEVIEDLEPGDCFLRFQEHDVLRYCHYVDETEEQELFSALGMTPVAEFAEDGAEHNLNRYRIFRK